MFGKKNKLVIIYIIFLIFIIGILGCLILKENYFNSKKTVNHLHTKNTINQINYKNVLAEKKPANSSEKKQAMEQNCSFNSKIEMSAYRLAVKKGIVSLASTTRITGDFHRRRRSMPWVPGMWCIRLLDENMNVLDEDIIRNPNEECRVLDPMNPDTKGNPQISQFAGTVSDTMVQVLFQTNEKAKWIKIYRLNSRQKVDWKSDPSEQIISVLLLK